MNELPDNQDPTTSLMQLFIDWQALITERINTKRGTPLRSELDTIYQKTLPTIISITEEVDDQRLDALIRLAHDQLKQRDRSTCPLGGEYTRSMP